MTIQEKITEYRKLQAEYRASGYRNMPELSESEQTAVFDLYNRLAKMHKEINREYRQSTGLVDGDRVSCPTGSVFGPGPDAHGTVKGAFVYLDEPQYTSTNGRTKLVKRVKVSPKWKKIGGETLTI